MNIDGKSDMPCKVLRMFVPGLGLGTVYRHKSGSQSPKTIAHYKQHGRSFWFQPDSGGPREEVLAFLHWLNDVRLYRKDRFDKFMAIRRRERHQARITERRSERPVPSNDRFLRGYVSPKDCVRHGFVKTSVADVSGAIKATA
ncbi:MAG: hypothetical protein Q8L64_04370 [bacterium]|nr:hypothetical protein [bacterium]